MIELLYQRVEKCPPYNGGYDTCEEYFDSVADNMQQRSFYLFYAFLGLGCAVLIGDALLFWGFGSASERMNKRVRDAAFTSMLRQEVAWFDLQQPGTLVSQLAVDAAMLHAFSGEPIRTLVLNVASVVVGIIVSFVFMWYVKYDCNVRMCCSGSPTDHKLQALCSPHLCVHPVSGTYV